MRAAHTARADARHGVPPTDVPLRNSVGQIIQGDCLDVLSRLPRGIARLAYLDPPFNTRKTWKTHDGADAFHDTHSHYLDFLLPRVAAVLRCLSDDGSLFVHLDQRHVHEVKVALDGLLGQDHFKNEVIWAFDYGGRSKCRWPVKHQTILWYVKDPARYVFNRDAADRLPYLAPGLVGKDKAALGKFPTDVWWQTIVPTSGAERTGYPTQKPLQLLDRIVRVHSDPGDLVLDPFAGSGTTGEAAASNGRRFILIDESREALRVMERRLERLRLEERAPPTSDGPPAGELSLRARQRCMITSCSSSRPADARSLSFSAMA